MSKHINVWQVRISDYLGNTSFVLVAADKRTPAFAESLARSWVRPQASVGLLSFSVDPETRRVPALCADIN